MPHRSTEQATRRRLNRDRFAHRPPGKIAYGHPPHKRILETEEVECVALGRVWILEKTAPRHGDLASRVRGTLIHNAACPNCY